MNENDKNETGSGEKKLYKMAMIGIGQAGCNIVEKSIKKAKTLKDIPRYKALIDALQDDEDPDKLRTWGIDLGNRIERGDEYSDITHRKWAGATFNIDGAGGRPGIGEKYFEQCKNDIDEVLDALVNKSNATLYMVAFSTSGGTGASWGPLFIRELAKKAAGKESAGKESARELILHIYAFIIIPPDKVVKAPTVLYSLGRFLQYYQELYEEGVLEKVDLLPILLSNEQLIKEIQIRTNIYMRDNEIYQFTDTIPTDIMAKLLYTTLGRDIPDFTPQLDPKDIGSICPPERPFVVPYFVNISNPIYEEGDTQEEFNKKLTEEFNNRIEYLKEGLLQIDLGKVNVTDANSLLQYTETEPLTIEGVTATIGEELAVYKILPVIYGTDGRLVSSISMETWIDALLENLKYTGDGRNISDLMRADIVADHYAITLGDKTEGEPPASIITLLVGPKLKVLDDWLDRYYELKKRGRDIDRMTRDSVGTSVDEFRKALEMVEKYAGRNQIEGKPEKEDE